MRNARNLPSVDWSGDWKVLAGLVPYLLEFKGRVAAAMVFLVGAKLANVTVPIALKHIVDGLDAEDGQMVAIPVALLLGYGALRFATSLFGELRDAVFARVAERAMRRIGLKVFEHLHRLELDFHLSRRTGGLSRDIERGTTGISFLLRFMLFNIIPTLLEIAMVIGILLYNFDIWFALLIAVAITLYIGFSVLVTEWRTRFVRESNEMDSLSNTRAIDSLLNFETVKYFANETYEADQYDRNLASWEQARMKNRLSLATLNSGQGLIVAASITGMMFMAAYQVKSGEITIGDLVMLNAYMIQLFIPLNFLGFVYREIKNALANIERMLGLLRREPRVTDKPGAPPLEVRAGHVRFEHVDFGYHPERRILHDVSLDIPAGRKVAVVGPSGAGKSTLARLLFRFYDVDGGRITIDGQDIRDVDQDSLRRALGVVPQDTVLFNDTLFYNIQYGDPEADAAAVRRAARLAHLEHFIEQLPEGYDTVVGERGLKLSGGEKQRVAIARTILKNPRILIFDEATSSLDSASEKAILGALNEVARDHTTLVIAHRLSTVVDADNIVVLEQGRIVEQGRHDRLLRAGGPYASLWEYQQKHRAGAAGADPDSPDNIEV
jgi:ATP-binding cassette subfamily B protein